MRSESLLVVFNLLGSCILVAVAPVQIVTCAGRIRFRYGLVQRMRALARWLERWSDRLDPSRRERFEAGLERFPEQYN